MLSNSLTYKGFSGELGGVGMREDRKEKDKKKRLPTVKVNNRICLG